MKKKKIPLRAAIVIVICFILSAWVWALPSANASGGSPQQERLIMTINGGVLGAGNQIYTVQQSGLAISASLAGYRINQSDPIHFNYYLFSDVEGLFVNGTAFFTLSGVLEDGRDISLVGYAVINGEVPAVCFPSYSTTGSCAPGDTSAIPAFFLSQQSEISVCVSSNHRCVTSPERTIKVPMAFESAYLNPFGGPIVLGSANNNFTTLLIISRYSTGTVYWSNVSTAGEINGTYGESSVSGILTQVTSEQENLVSGVALDHGVIAFSNMVGTSGNAFPALDASGRFHGASTIPTQGAVDCSSSIGFPAGSGLCTEYGFLSTGTFKMYGVDSIIRGSYSASWGIPALTFTAISLARVTRTTTTT